MKAKTPYENEYSNYFLPTGPHVVFHGLAGTGKSFIITRSIEQLIEEKKLTPREILIISFDKNLRKKYINSCTFLTKQNVFTIHSLCFQVLRALNKLPVKFKEQKDIIDSEQVLTNKDYDNLILNFLALETEELIDREERDKGFYFITELLKKTLLVCDEVQDFREDYIEVIKKLKELGVKKKIIIAGDEHQKIYSFQNKHNRYHLSDVLKKPSNLFGEEAYEEITLKKNYRIENNSILKFTNSFLQKEFDISDELLYESTLGVEAWKAKPVIKLFTHVEEEFEFVTKIVENIDTYRFSVQILGRSNKDIKQYKNAYHHIHNITVSTVHKIKGGQSDYVFYIGFSYDRKLDPEISTITYTAISRAKKKLYITSAHPVRELHKIFDKNTYKKVSVQKRFPLKGYSVKKKIKKDKNFTMNKIIENRIDSIVLKVKQSDCPFHPYIKSNNTYQARYCSTKKVVLENGFSYAIEKNHPSGSYFFKFFDLNLLKKNSFTDKDIIKFCSKFVIEFFDNRVVPERIFIQELHLCVFKKFEEKKNLVSFSEGFIDTILNSTYSSILDQDRRKYTNTHDLHTHGISFLKKTLYINHHSKSYKGLTTTIYCPKNKINENRICIDNLLKIEFRAKKKFLDRKIGFLGLTPHVANLLDIVKSNSLDEVIRAYSLNYLGGFDIIDEFYDKNIMKKLGG